MHFAVYNLAISLLELV